MKNRYLSLLLLALSLPLSAEFISIQNGGFTGGINGWTSSDLARANQSIEDPDYAFVGPKSTDSLSQLTSETFSAATYRVTLDKGVLNTDKRTRTVLYYNNGGSDVIVADSGAQTNLSGSSYRILEHTVNAGDPAIGQTLGVRITGAGDWASFTGITVEKSSPELTAPVNVSTSSITRNSFTLNWQPLLGAVSYTITAATDPSLTNGISFTGTTKDGSQASIIVDKLSEKTVYYFGIKANYGGGSSSFSTGTVTTDAFSLVYDDFENGYNLWSISGTAFGSSPANSGSTNNNTHFVNSYVSAGNLNAATGKLTSSDFNIAYDFINFEIAGGAKPNQISFNLVVEGHIVKSLSGNQNKTFLLSSWDVTKWKGKTAHFEIVDNAGGNLGYILLDNISFSNVALQERKLFELSQPSYYEWFYRKRMAIFATEDSAVPADSTILLGDSITEVLPMGKAPARWKLVNRGIQGDCVGGWKYLGLYDRLQECVYQHQPDKVCIAIGINDIVKWYNTSISAPIDEMEKGYRMIVEGIQQHSPKTQIYLQTILPTAAPYENYNDEVIAVNQRIKKVAMETKVNFVDTHTLFKNPQGELTAAYSKDGIHLTSAGYDIWYQSLTKILDGQQVAVTYNSSKLITLTGYDSKQFNLPANPKNGTLTPASDFSTSGKLVYTPNLNYSGLDSFTYTVSGDSRPFTVYIDVIAPAPLAAGDAIAVDLADGSGNAAKFNVINTKNGSIAAGSVVKYADGTTVADGVAVKLDNAYNAGGPSDSKTDWGGTAADFYYADEAEDLVFQNPKSPITVTFSGLDNALKYNVRIYALFDDGKGATDTFTVTDGASTQTSVMKRADRKAKATLEEAGGVFNRVSTDGSGNIVASVQVTAGSGWTAYNAVVLEVASPTVEITGYEPIADITVKSGDTNKDDVAELGLPSTVTIKGTSDTRAVDSWSASPSYDNDTPGTYTFTATLSSTLPAGYKDETPETVTVNVIVNGSTGIKILDGALSSIKSPNNLSGSAMTVMSWIKVDSSAPRGCVLHVKENSVAKTGVAIYITGSNGTIEYWDETNYRNLTSPANGGLVFPRDQWVHLAVTISTTNKSIIYINGVGTDTTRTIAGPVANAPLLLGINADNSDESKNVSYDEVAVFGSELSVSQIQDIYASGNGREIASDYANMLLYWRFEDSPQANTAADSDNEADSPGTISGTKGTSFNWVGGKQVGPTIITPTIGLQLSLTGTELAWTVAQEVDVKAYQIFADGQLFDTVQAVDADFYSITVPAGAVIEFRVIDKSGFSKSYVPQDGNVKIEIYDLKKGWNLIAVTSDDVNLAPLKQDTVGHVWGWREGRYQSVDSAQATEALWVYATADKTIYLSGKKSEAKITLQAGWNMVGPVENDYIPEKAATVYAWNQVYDAIAGEQKLLIGGKGYWIFSL